MYSTPLTLRALALLSLGMGTTIMGITASPVDKVELAGRQGPGGPVNSSNRLGCYTDNEGGQRALNADSYGSYNDMTADNCASFCKRYPVFGLEYGRECWCGERLGPLSRQVDDAECSFPCSGDATQRCGAGDRLDVYENGKWKPRAPDTSLPGAPYLGCFLDPGNPRALPDKVVSRSDMTARVCQSICTGYRYFGTEYGRECWCGNFRPSSPAPESDCSFGCAGDDDETCGAGLRLSVYGPVSEPGQSSVSSARPSTTSSLTSSSLSFDTSSSSILTSTWTTSLRSSSVTIPTPTLPTISISSTTVPTLDLPTTSSITLPTLDLPTTSSTTLPTVDLPTTSSTTLPTVDLPTTSSITFPTLDLPTTSSITLPTLDLPTISSTTLLTSVLPSSSHIHSPVPPISSLTTYTLPLPTLLPM